MDRDSEKPLRLFVNPFTWWTELALKTGEALWASAHAAAARANAPKVAVIPTADAPAPKAARADAPMRAAAKAKHLKAARAKMRSEPKARARAGAKRRARR